MAWKDKAIEIYQKNEGDLRDIGKSRTDFTPPPPSTVKRAVWVAAATAVLSGVALDAGLIGTSVGLALVTAGAIYIAALHDLRR